MQGLQDISIGSKLKEQCKDVKEVPVKENLLFCMMFSANMNNMHALNFKNPIFELLHL